MAWILLDLLFNITNYHSKTTYIYISKLSKLFEFRVLQNTAKSLVKMMLLFLGEEKRGAKRHVG